MKAIKRPAASPIETELKLALPGAEMATLEQRLARVPILTRREVTRREMHSVYYDTPDQNLHKLRVALRVRQIGTGKRARWRQILKLAGEDESALTSRGEWESAVPAAALEWSLLQATPWLELDADGALFRNLAPCFVTTFTRVSWLVRRRDRSVVEVSLDVGEIVAGEKRAPICELELELWAGEPKALFDIATAIARSIAVLPATFSKAERGYALAQNRLNVPRATRPPALTVRQPLSDAAARVLHEAFGQFITNLNMLRDADDAALVHQARVGWRRFKGAYRLFKPVFFANAARDATVAKVIPPAPPWALLEPLVAQLGELRDLDVAGSETLPVIADEYIAGDPDRKKNWQVLMQSFTHAAAARRHGLHALLAMPDIGAALLAFTEWLSHLPQAANSGDPVHGSGSSVAVAEIAMPPIRDWAAHRVARLHKHLRAATKAATFAHGNSADEHRVRILAKRLRYGIEALHALVAKNHRRDWHRLATDLQSRLGAKRDLVVASQLAAKFAADPGLAEFLRGLAVGINTR